MSATTAGFAADLVLIAHFAFVIFVVIGGLLVLRWRRLIWVHVPAALWGAGIELGGWVCPLTPLESRLRMQAGEVGSDVDFVARHLLPLLYPDGLTRGVQIILGIFVLGLNALIYLAIARRSGSAASRLKTAGRPLAICIAAALSAWLFGAAPLQSGQPPSRSMSIEEYTPRSTLVVPAHPVPKARYPVIDVHSHHPNPTPDGWAKILGEMDSRNLRVLVNLSGGTGDGLKGRMDVIRRSRQPDRMVFFATPDFSHPVTSEFGVTAAKQFEADVKAGAKGLKIFKNFGKSVRYADGRRVPVDAAEMDPLWAAAGRLGVPVLIHVGEPEAFWQPVDKNNERWLELMLHPDRRMSTANGAPAFDALMAERDRLFARHSKTHFIIAHMGWHANDLARLGRLLDKLPNTSVETGAILAELGRQPHTARGFFTKYQDRVMFGKDTYAADEFPYYWRTFETNDEYFDYYRKYHAFWQLYGMNLPDEVLKKLYYRNALRIVPGLSKTGFPVE